VNLENKRVCVTGGSGFLGSHVVEKLKSTGCEVLIPRSSVHDLRRREEVRHMYEEFEPNVVIHLAAQCGGIGINQKQPGRFLYDNLVMGLEMLDVAREFEIEKYVQVGTVCAYPKFCPVPFKEEDLWNGFPEETNAPYGIAKKTLMLQCQAYRQQYGMNAISVVPVNLYGPRDNFDAFSSHVIPALIRKCVEAKYSGESRIKIWGTGNASREFLYVEDCAEAIVSATQRYDGAEPINIGNGSEIKIKDLVEAVADVVGFHGIVEYDPSKPDGQPRRCLDVGKAKQLFNFEAKTDLMSGLRATVEWYVKNSCSNQFV
jgi:GDP-L-fucose synthase